MIAGTHSGAGKTTVASGLMAALRQRERRVAAAKVGPDFIDPGYHALATGRPGRNLDAWICGASQIGRLAERAARGADVLVVEGVMGLFDGGPDLGDDTGGDRAGVVSGDDASTAHVARLLRAPVVLVVDASAVSRSIAATVHGFMTFDPRVDVAGVILNRIGSDGHETVLREALAPLGIPVLGALRRDEAFRWRDRHLGLVPVVEQPEAIAASLDRLATVIEQQCDVDALLSLAGRAVAIEVEEDSERTGFRPGIKASRVVRIAVATGSAFSFVYPDNLEAIEVAGAEIIPFDPLSDQSLPEGIDGVYVGGGFPEVFAPELSANQPLLADVRTHVKAGLVTLAECGGLLWLTRSLGDDPMAGVIPAAAQMTERLTLGYRRAMARVGNPMTMAGGELRGHEFHYSTIEPQGDALQLVGRHGTSAGGFSTPTMLASYLHLHFGGDPTPAEHFVAVARNNTARGGLCGSPDTWGDR